MKNYQNKSSVLVNRTFSRPKGVNKSSYDMAVRLLIRPVMESSRISRILTEASRFRETNAAQAYRLASAECHNREMSSFSCVRFAPADASPENARPLKRLSDLLLIGDPRLYENCQPVLQSELALVPAWVADLHNVMEEIRAKYQFGRGIAAPQLGIMKRLFYLNIDEPKIIINPEITETSDEMDELWDDCMSFPNLLVRVRRHRNLVMAYRDENWVYHKWHVINEWRTSELIQHEYDHLNGVLCTMRAIDDQSFRWRPTSAETSATAGGADAKTNAS